MLPRILDLAHELVRQAISEGDVVIDATLGNGHDTLFLAQCVGESGHVFGFDVQLQAIEQTEARLMKAGISHRATLYLSGHEHLEDRIPAALRGNIAAIMFNLGYLPHGDPLKVTQTDSSLKALSQAIQLIRSKGLISVVLYSNHIGGAEEADAVLSWAKSLPSDFFQVAWYQLLNKRNPPPSLLMIERIR
jgi:SAM-dependent methyltransferase